VDWCRFFINSASLDLAKLSADSNCCIHCIFECYSFSTFFFPTCKLEILSLDFRHWQGKLSFLHHTFWQHSAHLELLSSWHVN
jgi:hypothetical protein